MVTAMRPPTSSRPPSVVLQDNLRFFAPPVLEPSCRLRAVLRRCRHGDDSPAVRGGPRLAEGKGTLEMRLHGSGIGHQPPLDAKGSSFRAATRAAPLRAAPSRSGRRGSG